MRQCIFQVCLQPLPFVAQHLTNRVMELSGQDPADSALLFIQVGRAVFRLYHAGTNSNQGNAEGDVEKGCSENTQWSAIMNDTPGHLILEDDDLLSAQSQTHCQHSDSDSNQDCDAELHKCVWPDPAIRRMRLFGCPCKKGT